MAGPVRVTGPLLDVLESLIDGLQEGQELHGWAIMKDVKRSGPTVQKLEQHFTVEPVAKAFSPAKLHQFGMYLDGKWYALTAKEGSYTNDPIGVLDITILSEKLLDPLLGIRDQRTDKRIDFVGGIRGLGELEKRVNSGEMAVAFSLHPVTIQQLFDICGQWECDAAEEYVV